LRGRSGTGKSLEFGRNVSGLGCADPLEYLQCLPQEDLGLRGVAAGQGAPAQAGQCVGLVSGAGDRAGQFQGLLVALLSLRELTADPVQRPSLVKRLGLTTPVADVWLYQIWAFVAPGLNTREKLWSCLFPGAAIPLFGLGITLCYLSLGRSLRYLLGLTPGGVQNLIQVDQYLSFAMAMMLAFGLAFEVPLLIVMLNLAGVLTHERFRKWRRVLIFGVFLIAGMANPSPDPLTMLILGGTCAVLVEAAEFIVWANDRRRARLHPDPYAGLADNELSPLPSGGGGKG